MKTIADPPRRGKLRLAVLISGRGSNMAAITRSCQSGRIDAEVAIVISDRADAPGIAVADALGVITAAIEPGGFEDRSAFETALAAAIDASGASLVALAGFMRILSAAFVQRYTGRLLNIHPSLLPKYKGLHTHRRALEAGEREHGASVHFVTAELDGGPVICQGRVRVQPGESEEGLAGRVMLQEHRIYPMVIGLIAAGRLELRGATVMLDGRALRAPLVADGAENGADRIPPVSGDAPA
ncbi:MAG TPA: phosphoribosylglycinamide formyltransferase [Steroidobacteraceae bacterium]